MAVATIGAIDAGVARLSGDLVLAHVSQLLKQCVALFQGQTALTINLQEVGDVDSSGLVLLLELLDHAQASGLDLRYSALTPDLLKIARLSNAEALLLPSN